MLDFLRSRPARMATILLFVQAGVYYSMSRTEVIPNTAPWSEFPTEIGEWRLAAESPIDPEVVALLQPDDYINRNYTSPRHPSQGVGLFIGYFKTQRKGLAPHSPKACLPGAGWAPVSSEVRMLDVPGESVPVNYFLVGKQNTRMLALYWYQQGKRAFANEYMAQLYAVPELFLHGRTDIALVRVIVPADLSGSAGDVAMQFGREIYPLVRKQIP
jgi:EpsI family protein